MSKFHKAPKFLGKVCLITGGSFIGTVCMPHEASYNGGYSYACITVGVENNTVDVSEEFAWVSESDLELHSSITSIDGFQFYDSEDEEDEE